LGGEPDESGFYGSDHYALLANIFLPCEVIGDDTPKKEAVISGSEDILDSSLIDAISNKIEAISYLFTLVLGAIVSFGGFIYARKYYSKVLLFLSSPSNLNTNGDILEVE